MRRLLFALTFCLSSYIVFAAGEEKVCVGTAGSPICDREDLGHVNPCSTTPFIVQNVAPPSGFVMVAKYEWFVNGISVKTTTDPNDYGLNWQIKSSQTEVYCQVTYKKADNTLSSVYTSTSFTPIVKSLNFNEITTSIAQPNFGCTNTVSYSLSTFTCQQYCDAIYDANLNNYNITWQAPAGWV